uniref:Uncharacterized protein n=2 Tax=Oryza sativa subsp. japonica TaxID=39947 RepID=Q7Y0B4_ORYSJ|nr:hypothetical protein [Oryza sativa Japonica Group]ABF97983.1 hypothetical protein LOC_Os03g45500 [Oryza sativa Japonica Group]
MEVKKPVGSRCRQLALKVMTPNCGGGDVASREDDSTSWRHTRWPVGEDVDALQPRHNKPAVQAETPVDGGEAPDSLVNGEPVDVVRQRKRKISYKEN